jgi:hypothetical protein
LLLLLLLFFFFFQALHASLMVRVAGALHPAEGASVSGVKKGMAHRSEKLHKDV